MQVCEYKKKNRNNLNRIRISLQKSQRPHPCILIKNPRKNSHCRNLLNQISNPTIIQKSYHKEPCGLMKIKKATHLHHY